MTLADPLVPLPRQPDGVAWPAQEWPEGEQATGDPERLAALLDPVFSVEETPELARSLAIVAVQGGRLVAERYAPGVDRDTTLISWSMAKSVTHALLGVLVGDGRLDPSAPAAVPEWTDPADPRRAITVDDLLAMRSGLHFVEDYVDDTVSDCLEMLWGSGADDMAHYAAGQPLEHPIGTTFNYSSGTTNILARLVGSLAAGRDDGAPAGADAITTFLRERLLDPIGMRSATAKCDAAGTWVGSSYLFATARDFARFGLLYQRDGVWDGRRLLPEGWVDSARTLRSIDPEDGWGYGHHWWVRVEDELGTFWANGYEGQMICCVPALDLVVVRLGKTPSTLRPHLERFWSDVVDCFRP
ncbi:serine hydrolase domain-containing protein [Dermatobacter hominis]|uniref:serine hydrolase domain-containing protein n=1 Tax=Dermatobacter hominis TaxID=2884263 RepID=UPI001D1081DD|nr:serine hydrolase [Dermatobacter hominis]UDY36345.1 beta-lactamase family protein [Dermatobacter hominis]